jgi:hypothetical protein
MDQRRNGRGEGLESSFMKKLADHLGGHGNKTWVDLGSLEFMKKSYNIKSMIDVGCGPGDQTILAQELGIDAIGIDGDYTVDREFDCIIHDFTLGTCSKLYNKYFDLAWCVEFLEHVEEKYMDNYMDIFTRCKYIICTYAPPQKKGHHHVNCQTEDYWIEKFKGYGMNFDKKITENIKNASTMKKKLKGPSFMEKTGLVFKA